MSPLLDVRTVTKRYGSFAAVREVSFALDEGEILSIIGPNGAGKTTIMNVIAGSAGRWTGEIEFAGISLGGLKPHEIARMGVVRTFQVARPFAQMSLVENVMVGTLFGRRDRLSLLAARREGLAVLDEVGLGDRAAEPAAGLNASERKRLEIARALAMQPRLIMLDEVMAGLNASEVDAAVEVVGRLRDRGISILLVEHVMRAVSSLADRVVVLNRGEKVTEGQTSEVLGADAVADLYLGRRGPASAERR